MKRRITGIVLAIIFLFSFSCATAVNAVAVTYGDYNEDYSVTTIDARMSLMIALGTVSAPSDITIMDVDASGSITTADSRLVLLYSIGNISVFPCEEGRVLAEEIYLSFTECTVSLGASKTLTAAIYPKNVTDNEVSFSSSNASIASVSADGVITGKRGGIAEITVSSGRAFSKCRVIVGGGATVVTDFSKASNDHISQSEAFSVSGTVSSDYPITSIRCAVIGTTIDKTANFSTSYNIMNYNLSDFASSISLNSAGVGEHTLEIYATDEYHTSEIKIYSYTYYINAATASIGKQRQVMWGENLVDTTLTTATLTLNSPMFNSDPVLVLDEDWEGDGSDYYSLVEDVDSNNRKFYRLYYNGWNMTDVQIHICYAYSYDGINWVKPNLGIYSFNGSTANNIILGPTKTEAFDNFFVFKDTNPNCRSSQRYKAVAESYVSTALSLYSWVSSDGIHWTKYKCITTDGTFDSVNTAFWDSTNNKYYCYFRYFDSVAGRAIKMTTSTDFINWTTAVPLTYSDGLAFQMYTNNIQKYYRANQVFIGFPTHYTQRPGWTDNYDKLCSREIRLAAMERASRYGLAITDTMFMVSYDGCYWNRFDEAWLTPGPERDGGWVYGDCYFCYGMIETPNTHNLDNEISMYCFEGKWTGEASYLYRYTIRIDGFAGYKSSYAQQKLVTQPFTFTGSKLKMNFKTSAAGSIYVRILDEDGNYLGYTSGEVFGDRVDREVTFSGLNLSSLQGRSIRLEFLMSDAEIFSFVFE